MRAVALSMLVTLACTPGQPEPQQTAPRANLPAPTPEQIVGRWLMISEEDPERGEPIRLQDRRLLAVRADASFAVENYRDRAEGSWRLDGSTLALGDAKVDIVRIEDDRLVLIEDVPKLYQDFAPGPRVQNTYRRLSERELGPMLGRELVTSTPTAGSYAAAFKYQLRKYATTEIASRDRIDGHATLELAEDGTASGCFGVATRDQTSGRGYGPGQRSLIGWAGNWRVTDDGTAATKAERLWRGSCADPGTSLGRGLELECLAIAANEVLPLPALACRLVGGPQELRMLAINPADTERAGPYTLQTDTAHRMTVDQGRPWFILGAPRLVVESVDEPHSDPPQVSFTSSSVVFVESNYVYPSR